jgi:N-acetylglucosaminyl-diphospho-decaprenol L-rhamnosyltransferase
MTLPSSKAPAITFSIVSHGQGDLIASLLSDLTRELDLDYEVVLTLNIPESEDFITAASLPSLKVIRNNRPKGFGANHNAAFDLALGVHFAVLNPDIRLNEFKLRFLLDALMDDKVGVCGPAVYSINGVLEDSVRKFPTVLNLLKRRIIKSRPFDFSPDSSGRYFVDWLAGMFLIFRREAFKSVAGFDERYFMYMEDVDICRRLKLAGWTVCYEPRTRLVHDARRASHKSLKHLKWHVCSAFRYFTTNYKVDLQERPKS